MTTSKIVGASVAAAMALTLATSANAALIAVFHNSLDTENGGASASNYTGFTGLTVTQGAVDLVKTGDFGLTCWGDMGTCVDLKGSSPAGARLTTDSFDFNAGDTILFGVHLGGDQRMSSQQDFYMGFDFAAPTLMTSFSIGDAFNGLVPSEQVIYQNTIASSLVAVGSSLKYYDAFNSYQIILVAGQAGSLRAFVGDNGGGAGGPLLDEVFVYRDSDLDLPAVCPEPGAWALMIAGFGLTGVMLRSVKFTGSPSNIRRHAPRLGEDTAQVRAEMGLKDA